MLRAFSYIVCVLFVLSVVGCGGGKIREVDPDRKILLELKFNDSDVKKASMEFVAKVQRQMDRIKKGMNEKPVILFERIDNKTDEHISGLDVIADRILTDLLDTGEFFIVDKRERETISEELSHQKESGLYAEETRVKAGRRIAPNARLRGQIISETQENRDMVAKSYFIRLNMVDMESGLTIVQSTTEIKKIEDK